ncbi:shikimate dehydrogenase [Candidatus Poribacteria bacterium]|nr:MAG: shikimate dehydrogenase [Candidatus Poribacteria bacterium]
MDRRQAITGHTKIVGVIGSPINHSRSPQMHNAALSKAGLDFVYVPFHVSADAIDQAINGFKALKIIGINVTLPHKQSVIPYLTSISHEADLIGAVNTLTFLDNGIHGDNTDAPGFLRAMNENNIPIPIGKDVVVLGAGGSARAIVVALALADVNSITIVNRTVPKAITLAEELTKKISKQYVDIMSKDNVEKSVDVTFDTNITGMGFDDKQLPEAIVNCAMLVNTTSSGMDESQPLLINQEWLQSETIVYDIVYTPPITKLLKAAQEMGCTTIEGIGMLIHQGAIAFEQWTGVEPCVNTMKNALLIN